MYTTDLHKFYYRIKKSFIYAQNLIEFCNKICAIPYKYYSGSQTFLISGTKKYIRLSHSTDWIFDQKFLFSKSFFVVYFDQSRLDSDLFYEIRSQKSYIHWVFDKSYNYLKSWKSEHVL